MDSGRDGLLLMLRLWHVVLLRGTTMFSRIGEGLASKRLRRTSPSSTIFFQHDIPLVGRDLTEYLRKILTVPLCSFTGAAEREIVLDGIESMCFSCVNYDTELNRSRKV